MQVKSLSSLLLLLFVVSPCTRVPAQVMGNYQQQNNVQRTDNYQAQYRAVPRPAELTPDGKVTFTINALSNQTADSYVAIFSIFQVGSTAGETNGSMNARVQALIGGLAGIGVTRDDVYVDMVNFLPTYAFSEEKKIFSKKTLTEVPTGFQLQKNLHVRYRDPELLDKIVTVAAEQEVYDIIKVDYQIDRPQDVYNELRRLAFAYLDTLEKIYVGQGLPLDSSYVNTAENAWVAYPGDRYESYTAFASQQLSAADRNGSIVDKVDKPKLRFYNAIPANDYDLVINPNLLEPAAQFTYSLKVSYTLPPPVPATTTEVKTQYFWMTPDGTLRPVRLEE